MVVLTACTVATVISLGPAALAGATAGGGLGGVGVVSASAEVAVISSAVSSGMSAGAIVGAGASGTAAGASVGAVAGGVAGGAVSTAGLGGGTVLLSISNV